jgi:hypothetical protein
MKKILLLSAAMALGAAADNAQPITPGSGSLTDAAGNVWTITQSGSIMEGNQYTPGGGGTAALTIANGTVYGEDNGSGPVNPGGWFALSGNGQSWAPSAAPAASTASPVASTPVAGTSSQTAATSTVPAAAPVTVCAATASGAASSGFTTANGQIYSPNGTPFIARGVDVMYGNGNPSAAQIQASFPGTNFVRLAIYNYDSPASLSAYVNDLTSHGIVVELENHNNGAGNAGGSQGTIFTGAALAQEQAWYASVASAFANNPAVWFGTNNEPSQVNSSGQTDPAALSAWQQTTYNTIRAAGNNAPVMLEANSWGSGQTNAGYAAADYAGMTNVIWDLHYYGWVSGYSTNQSTVSSTLASMISDTSAIQSANGKIPVLIGEYGNSTTGQAIDPNGAQVVAAVQGSGLGSAAWAWGTGNPGDGLTNGDGTPSAYGQQVAGYFALTQNAPASIWACQGAPVTTTAAAAPPLVPQNSLSVIPAPSFGSN